MSINVVDLETLKVSFLIKEIFVTFGLLFLVNLSKLRKLEINATLIVEMVQDAFEVFANVRKVTMPIHLVIVKHKQIKPLLETKLWTRNKES